MTMTIEQVLKEFPWPKAWLKQGLPPVNTLWTFKLNDVTLEQFWPYIANTTDYYNQMIQFPPQLTYEEKGGKTIVTSPGLFEGTVWVEEPWNWKYPEYYELSRDLGNSGPVFYARTKFIMEKDGDGILVHQYMGWVIRGQTELDMLMPISAAMEQNSVKVLDIMAGYARTGKDITYDRYKPQPLKCSDAEIDSIREKSIKYGIKPKLVDALIEHVKLTPPERIDRIRPKELAMLWSIPLDEVISACLYSVKTGLLSITWDTICPHCRGVRTAIYNLGQIPENDICEICGIDFDCSVLNAVEVVFHVHKDIREVKPQLYCTAEPHRKKHMKLQRTLPPGSEELISIDLRPARYRLRVRTVKQYSMLDIIKGEKSNNEIRWNANEHNKIHKAGLNTPILLKNNTDKTQIFVIEEDSMDQIALLPADIFNLQDFRDLFSEQAISVNLKLDIGMQTVMFTDIVGSTRMYEREGDAKAFSKVRKHFIKAHDIIKAHKGAIVKTIGDAVMASFTFPADAMNAAIKLQRQFNSSKSIRIRISMHYGPCFAVNLNTSIDYFGRTINFASKLQDLVEEGQIAFTKEVESKLDNNTLKALTPTIKKVKFHNKAFSSDHEVFIANIE